jgi:heterodisulfide reductase subunit C
MTFGQIKTIIENQLIESYKDGKEFKQSLKEFKEDVLDNKNISKLYSLYTDLSTPQGLSEQDAYEFIKEGIDLIQKTLPKVNLPKGNIKESKNIYKNIDELVYVDGKRIDLNDRLKNKKELVKILTQPKNQIKESVNIPLSSMVKVANQSLKNYIETLDESSKKELMEIINEDTKSLKIKFESLKKDATIKLNGLIENESDINVKTKITETVERINNEKFDQVAYLKLKQLVESL